MSDELPFRTAIAVIVALTMSVVLPFRLRARTKEVITHRDEGLLSAVVLRVAGAGLWLCLLAYLIIPEAVQFAAWKLPFWLRWCGVTVGGACVGLMYWTLSSLGGNLTDTVVTRKEATLVTHGPYRWVRHPFYVTGALLTAAITLASANGLIGMYGVTVFLLLAMRTPLEERMLLRKFGEEYRRYMERTGRFLPRLGRPEA